MGADEQGRIDTAKPWPGEISPQAQPAPRVGPDTLPELVRKVRRIADLSQRELAEAAGVAQTTVAKLETGRLAPSLATLLRILAAARLFLVVTDEQGKA